MFHVLDDFTELVVTAKIHGHELKPDMHVKWVVVDLKR